VLSVLAQLTFPASLGRCDREADTHDDAAQVLRGGL